MNTQKEICGEIVALNGQITALESTLRDKGIACPGAPKIGFDAANPPEAKLTLDDLMAGKASLESYLAKLRTGLRLATPLAATTKAAAVAVATKTFSPALSPADAKQALYSGKLTAQQNEARHEIARLESQLAELPASHTKSRAALESQLAELRRM